MDIKQLIGEATDYDKKLALEEKKPKSWCKSISAFANCFGGKLIFGVSNDNELVGLADAEGDAEKISEAIKTHLNPIPEFKLYFEKYEKLIVNKFQYLSQKNIFIEYKNNIELVVKDDYYDEMGDIYE